MMMRTKHNEAGFTVAEYVMAVAIMFTVAVAVVGGLSFGAGRVLANDSRDEALKLARTRIEYARALPYDSVGTVGGYVPGDLAPSETLPGGFIRTTEVLYVKDESLSGTQMRSTTKRIVVTVSWSNPQADSVTLETNIAGKSELSGGDVTIWVKDRTTGAGEPGATVRVITKTGAVAQRTTNSQGEAWFGPAPAGNIDISASLSGHAIDLSTVSGAQVIANQLNEWVLYAEEPLSAGVTVTSGGGGVDGASVSLVGPSSSSKPATFTAQTNALGLASFGSLLRGNYRVIVTGPKPQYGDVADATNSPSLVVQPAQSNSVTKSINKNYVFRVKLVNQSTGADITNGAVTLSPTTGVTKYSTDGAIHTYLLTTPAAYTIGATASGFLAFSGAQTIPTGQYDTQFTAQLVPDLGGTWDIFVKDTLGAPVGGATVTIKDSGGNTVATVTSDGNGHAIKTGLVTGASYTAIASKTGYSNSPSISSGAMPNGGTVNTDAIMSAGTFGEIRIKYRSNVSGSVTVRIFRSATSAYTASTNFRDVTFTAKDVEQVLSLPTGYYYWASYVDRTQTTPSNKATPSLTSYPTSAKTTSTTCKQLTTSSGILYLGVYSTN